MDFILESMLQRFVFCIYLLNFFFCKAILKPQSTWLNISSFGVNLTPKFFLLASQCRDQDSIRLRPENCLGRRL